MTTMQQSRKSGKSDVLDDETEPRKRVFQKLAVLPVSVGMIVATISIQIIDVGRTLTSLDFSKASRFEGGVLWLSLACATASFLAGAHFIWRAHQMKDDPGQRTRD